MPESATSPTIAPSDPENTVAIEDGSETADTMPEDLTVPVEPSDALEPDQQAPDADIPEPDQATAADDETKAQMPDDESEITLTVDETEDPEPDEALEYDDPDAEDDVQQEPTAPAEQVTKIFIWVRKGLATVGVQETGTDPEFATIASHDLDEIIPAIPGIVRAAQEKWLTEPHRKPAAPAPAARPRPASATRRVANNQNAPQTAALSCSKRGNSSPIAVARYKVRCLTATASLPQDFTTRRWPATMPPSLTRS